MTRDSQENYHHGALEEELLSLAEQRLNEGGLERMSLRELARQAKVSPNAPYRHFASKADLLSRLAARGFDQLDEACAKTDGSIDALGEAYVAFALDRPNMYGLMFGPLLAECDPEDADSPLAVSSMKSFDRIVQAAGTKERALAHWALAHGWVQLQLAGLTSLDQHGPLGIERLRRLLQD